MATLYEETHHTCTLETKGHFDVHFDMVVLFLVFVFVFFLFDMAVLMWPTVFKNSYYKQYAQLNQLASAFVSHPNQRRRIRVSLRQVYSALDSSDSYSSLMQGQKFPGIPSTSLIVTNEKLFPITFIMILKSLTQLGIT